MITNDTYTIKLTDELSATITLTRNGQEPPAESDEIVVEGRVSLPGNRRS